MHGTVNRVRGEDRTYCFLTELDEIPTPPGGMYAHKDSFQEPEQMIVGQRVSFDLKITPNGFAANNVTKATTSK